MPQKMKGFKKVLVLLFISMLAGGADCSKAEAAAAVAGGVGLLATATYGVLALGFGPAGIAAGSVASSMMSASATYGVGAGVVATAQSVGAAGLALGTKAVIASAGAVGGYKVGRWFK